MTSVDECTRAEIGVGAAIANGSHGEKGKIALLVVKETTINTKGLNKERFIVHLKEQEVHIIQAIVVIKSLSPKRFIKTVIKLL